ncbi:MAG: hypothetical protein EXQ47_00585 [Bryobacterales bacterium]|nr:hypothetical protein [Bryobacterales bacterium]
MKLRWLVLLAASSVLANAQVCGKECLRGLLDGYLFRMSRHDASKLNLTPTAKFTENGEAKPIGEGFWKTAGPSTYKLYVLDPQGGAAAVHAVVKEAGQPVSFLLRIKIAGRTISEVETIVARKGQAPFFAPEKLPVPPVALLQLLPLADRMMRKDLTAVTDAFYSGKYADEVNRFANGEQLGADFLKGAAMTKRRVPVVDVEHGLVLSIGTVSRAGAGPALLGEIFKVKSGKIEEVQGVMVNAPR